MSRSNETKNTSSPNFIFLVERDISSNNISLYEIKNGQKGKLLNNFKADRHYSNNRKVFNLLNFFFENNNLSENQYSFLYYYDLIKNLPNPEVKKDLSSIASIPINKLFSEIFDKKLYIDVVKISDSKNKKEEYTTMIKKTNTRDMIKIRKVIHSKSRTRNLSSEFLRNRKNLSVKRLLNKKYSVENLIDKSYNINSVKRYNYYNQDVHSISKPLNNESTKNNIKEFNNYCKLIEKYEDTKFAKSSNDNIFSQFTSKKEKIYNNLPEYNLKSKKPLFPFYKKFRMGEYEEFTIKCNTDFNNLKEYLSIFKEEALYDKVYCNHLVVTIGNLSEYTINSEKEKEGQKNSKNVDSDINTQHNTTNIRELTLIIKSSISFQYIDYLINNFFTYEISKVNIDFDFDTHEYLSIVQVMNTLSNLKCQSLCLSLKGVFNFTGVKNFYNIHEKIKRIESLEINDYGCVLQKGYLDILIKSLFEGDKNSKEEALQDQKNYKNVKKLSLENFHIYDNITLVTFFSVVLRFPCLDTLKLNKIIPYLQSTDNIHIDATNPDDNDEIIQFPEFLSKIIKVKILNKIANISIIDSPIISLSNFRYNDDYNNNEIDNIHLNFSGRNVIIKNSIIYNEHFLDIEKNDNLNRFKVSLTECVFSIIEEEEENKDKTNVTRFNLLNLTNNITHFKLQFIPITEYFFTKNSLLISNIITKHNLNKVASLTLDRCVFDKDLDDDDYDDNNIELNTENSTCIDLNNIGSLNLLSVFGNLTELTLNKNRMISLNFLNIKNKLTCLKLIDQDIDFVSRTDKTITKYNNLKTLKISSTTYENDYNFKCLEKKINFNSLEKVILEKKAFIHFKDFENYNNITDITLKNFDYSYYNISDTTMKTKVDLISYLNNNDKFTIFRIICLESLDISKKDEGNINQDNNIKQDSNPVNKQGQPSATNNQNSSVKPTQNTESIHEISKDKDIDLYINWPNFILNMEYKYGDFDMTNLKDIINEIFTDKHRKLNDKVRKLIIYNNQNESNKDIVSICEELKGLFESYLICDKKFK